ncbi:hypothetical protein HMPREF9130_2125 [Peptoniphilus sp. oral taxon 375 str. F0436]|nr:hypothetical protein HMPREF9130_2125 [Peptoniphilus sp. oral taxon 375 str. F0436]
MWKTTCISLPSLPVFVKGIFGFSFAAFSKDLSLVFSSFYSLLKFQLFVNRKARKELKNF